MKNVVVAIDSFKGSLATFQAGKAVEEGIRQVYDDAKVNIIPVADGGEGTVDAIVSANGGEIVGIEVSNPLGKKTMASYGIVSNTAIIEMSAAAGLTLIEENERNPLNTTTYGVGEMIADAINKGCRKFIIGIGGSATNDGGVGMLTALGFQFLDKNNMPVAFGAKGLKDIAVIKLENALKELKKCKFNIACDVKNVLCGENGCSAVFGPQKGATPEMVKDMDLWLENYAQLTKTVLPHSDANAEGTGAAGGLGFAFMSYLNGALKSGIQLVMEETKLEQYIKDADMVITGEGRLDGQSFMGKAPVGVATLAKKYGKPVIAFCGSFTDDAYKLSDYGIDSFFSILNKPCSLEEAMKTENAYNNLKTTSCQVFRLIKTGDIYEK